MNFGSPEENYLDLNIWIGGVIFCFFLISHFPENSALLDNTEWSWSTLGLEEEKLFKREADQFYKVYENLECCR